MLEVVAAANKAYTQVLQHFPDFLTGGNVTTALVNTLVKAQEKHVLAILEGIEGSHKNWSWFKRERSDAETRLLTHTSQLYDHLLTEAAHLPSATFNNMLSLSMGLMPPIQHTMPPVQPTIVLTTQVPTLGVIPSIGINFSVADEAVPPGGTGGDADDGDAQQLMVVMTFLRIMMQKTKVSIQVMVTTMILFC